MNKQGDIGERIGNTLKNLISGRSGYGMTNITTSSIVGKSKVSNLSRNLLYGSIGSSTVLGIGSYLTNKSLQTGMKAAMIYQDSIPQSRGRFGFRSTYQTQQAGISGLKFSFRGRKSS